MLLVSLISQTIKNWLDQYLPFALGSLPPETHLVGGAIRDILLKRKKKYLDLDFIVFENTIEVTKNLAKKYGASFVILDLKRGITRLVFSEIICDFAQQEGNSLETDLLRRDFTINSIAYSLKNGEIFDPNQGLADLNNKLIRMIAKQNLIDDPLRLLRAYRQASQLDFTIEQNTEKALKELAGELKKTAAERIKSELSYMLNSSQGNYWLKTAFRDNILTYWLPNAQEQNIFLLDKVDQIADSISQSYKIDISLEVSLAKLSLFLSLEPEKAKLELLRLTTSRTEIRLITTALEQFNNLRNNEVLFTIKQQYFLFLETKDSFIILALLCLAFNIYNLEINILLERYLDLNDPIAHPQPLIKGDFLLNSLKLTPSPLIGKLLTEIQIAQLEGRIKTTQEAIEFARDLLNR